ncbi:MAG: chorismate--pyruvate lyase family protein [Acidimicrobiales bacterium]
MTTGQELRDAELAAAVRVLPGTVTEFLEARAGEVVDAEVLSQRRTPAPAGNALGLAVGAELVSRSVLLTGRHSGRPFVYARSVLAAERLPPAVLRRLEESREPLGRVLADHGVATRREPVVGPPDLSPDADRVVGELGGAAVARRYRIACDGAVAVHVSEWFLRVTCDALLAGPG